MLNLLGPVELLDRHGEQVPISSVQRRAVLAVLGLEMNRVVASDRLIFWVWGEEPPASARTALHVHISATRKLLDDSIRLVTRAPGYMLSGAAERVDVFRFRAMVAEAERADDEKAVDLLAAALDLWRGAPLSDLSAHRELHEAMAVPLDAVRRRAVAALGERLVRLGRGGEVLARLVAELSQDPFDEPLNRLLLLCLWQQGRPADALKAYQSLRERLAAEFGIQPGDRLRATHQAILRQEVPVPQGRGGHQETGRPVPPRAATGGRPLAAPAQLPRGTSRFVGREPAVRWLDDQLGGPDGPGDAVITGPAGIGKTALLLKWAHLATDRFPDGQLFVDLAGFGPGGPLDPEAALTGFLRALGIDEIEIPRDIGPKRELYRKTLRDKRLLVVLDNARSAAQIRDLLPENRTCRTVITSRQRLDDLIAERRAAVLSMEPMTDAEGIAILTDILGDDRVTAEKVAATSLVALCDHLPLALRIVAARLASHPQWTIRYVSDELADEQERLYGLATEDAEISVTAALHLSVQALPPSAAGMFRMLGIHPGNHFDVHAAAAVAGISRADTHATLTTLASFHLVREFETGRYNQHDLIRLYGEQVAADDVPPAARRDATGRLLDLYLATSAIARGRASTGTRTPHGPVGRPPVSTHELAGLTDALAWFRLEERNLRALLSRAADDELDEHVWQLVDNIFVLYYRVARYDGLIWAATTGLRAARRLGDPVTVLRMSVFMATAIRVARGAEHAGQADRYLRTAIEECGGAGVDDPLLRFDVAAELGRCAHDLENWTECFRQHTAALDFARSANQPMLVASTHNDLAWAWVRSGQPDRAITHSEQVLALLRTGPLDPLLAPAQHTYGKALEMLGRDGAAMDAYQAALEAATALDNEHGQATYHAELGDLSHRLGRDGEARRHWAEAADRYDAIGMPSAARRTRDRSRTAEDGAGSPD